MTTQNELLSKIFLNKACNETLGYSLKHRPVTAESARLLQISSCDLARGRANPRIILTTGLGLSDKGTPLRTAALIAPGLKLLETLHERGFTASYTIYQATDFIAETNRLDMARARAVSTETKTYLQNFASCYFPLAAQTTHFAFGDDCPTDEVALEDISHHLTTTNHADVKAALSTILKYGEAKDSSRALSLRYASANILLNGGYKDAYPLKGLAGELNENCLLIPIGGIREKPFFQLTRQFSLMTQTPYEVIPLTTTTGEIPAYYPAGQHDPLIGSSARDFTPQGQTLRDFETLRAHGITAHNLAKLTV